MTATPGNPNCTAGDNGKPCAACASDWSKVGPIPTERCLPEPSVLAPRVVDEANRQFCSCNHCFVVKREQRNKEEKAVHAIADALWDFWLLRGCIGCSSEPVDDSAGDERNHHGNCRDAPVRAVLRLVGRLS